MPAAALGLLTPDDAAAALGCAAQTVREKLAGGRLPGVKYGKDWRIPADALREYLAGEAMKNIGARQPSKPVATVHTFPRRARRAPPALPALPV